MVRRWEPVKAALIPPGEELKMIARKNIKRFLAADRGVVATEYAVLVAAAGILLAVGVGFLYNSMASLFTAWARYFSGS